MSGLAYDIPGLGMEGLRESLLTSKSESNSSKISLLLSWGLVAMRCGIGSTPWKIAIGELSRYAKQTSNENPSLRSPISFSIALMAESTVAGGGVAEDIQCGDAAEGAAEASPVQLFATKWLMIMAEWIWEESSHFPTSDSVTLRKSWAVLVITNAARACAGLLKLNPVLDRAQIRAAISGLLLLQSWAGKLGADDQDKCDQVNNNACNRWASFFGMVDEAICSLLSVKPSEQTLLDIVVGMDNKAPFSTLKLSEEVNAKEEENTRLDSAGNGANGLLSSIGAATATLVSDDCVRRPQQAATRDSLQGYMDSQVMAERERSCRCFHLLMKRWSGSKFPSVGILLGIVIPRCAEESARLLIS